VVEGAGAVVDEAVFDHEPHVVKVLPCRLVLVCINLLADGSEVHGVRDDLVVVGRNAQVHGSQEDLGLGRVPLNRLA
jgi:hypothetical protein